MSDIVWKNTPGSSWPWMMEHRRVLTAVVRQDKEGHKGKYVAAYWPDKRASTNSVSIGPFDTLEEAKLVSQTLALLGVEG